MSYLHDASFKYNQFAMKLAKQTYYKDALKLLRRLVKYLLANK